MPSEDILAGWRRHMFDVTPDEVDACLEIMQRFQRRDYTADLVRAYRAGRASRRDEERA